MLKDSKSRYDKRMGLYKSGCMFIGSYGFFKVSEFQVYSQKIKYEFPGYKTRKGACKHLLATMLFIKNRGKQTIEDLPGFTWIDEVRDMPSSFNKPKGEANGTKPEVPKNENKAPKPWTVNLPSPGLRS
jgi:hypothetical protein